MYDLKPPRVFVHKRVYDSPPAVARMERMLAAMGHPATEDVDTDDTDRVLQAAGMDAFPENLAARARQGVLQPTEDPLLLFNTFAWDAADRRGVAREYHNSCSRRIAHVMAGAGEDFAFSRRDLHDPNRQFVCQGGWGLHSLKGCVHRCAYCGEGFLVNIMLDLEAFVEHVEAMMARRPQQKLYRYDMYSDSICFEPEYGASALLSECFARTADKYLLYYTKSDNVDHLLALPDREHSIFYCTLSTETACREMEPGAPSMSARIEGLRSCQEAGYVVRVGFSPIIPVHGWREEATRCLEDLFAAVAPDTVRLWVVSIMHCEEAEAALGADKLDPAMLDAMRRAAPQMGNTWHAPFPPEARAEIYTHYIREIARISPETPVSLCSEARGVWDALAGVLKMTPDNLYCCCGGTSVPR